MVKSGMVVMIGREKYNINGLAHEGLMGEKEKEN
jgi:hypothetical protein